MSCSVTLTGLVFLFFFNLPYSLNGTVCKRKTAQSNSDNIDILPEVI